METVSGESCLQATTLACQAVVESLEDGVIVVDAQSRIVDVNPAAEAILHRTAVEMIGRPATQVFSTWTGLLSLLGRQNRGRTEVELRQGGDCRSWDIQVSPIPDQGEQPEGHFIVLRDITGRRQVGRHVQEAKEAIEAANRAKSEFMSLASHEMRAPITCIKGYTDLLAKGTAGPINDLQAEFLTTIRANADRIALLISDLSDIARIETGSLRLELSSVAIDDVVGETVESIRAQFEGKGQVLIVGIQDDLPCVLGDHDRLVQVLRNLLSNAHKFTPSGGHIRVSARSLEDEEAGRWIHLAVQDNGIGIAPEEQEQVFDKFYRSDDREASEVPGSGLGLSIAKSLVEMHGGQMWLESALREGTTVHFTLPLGDKPCSRDLGVMT